MRVLKSSSAVCAACAILWLAAAGPARAGEAVAAGVKVVSDKNVDCSSPETIVAGILKPGMSDQEKAEAIFYFLVHRLYHHNAPEEPSADKTRKYSGEVTKLMDTVKALNVYGYAICGSQSWYVNYMANAVGLKGRIGGVDGHTVPEIKYGGGWHLFDVDMMGFVRRKDGTVPSTDEIKADHSLILETHEKTPDIYFKYDKPKGELACLHIGLQFGMYGRKVSSHSMNLTLRAGEKFTRWFTRQWGPDFHYYASPWAGSEHLARLNKNRGEGPSRDLTYFLFKEGARARFGNWELVYDAPLSKPACLDGVFAKTNVSHATAAPFLKPEKNDAPAEVVYNYYSPYGCAGTPKELPNPDDDVGGAMLEGEFASDNGAVSISLDCGKSWQEVHTGGKAFKVDVTPKLAAHYGWWVKLAFQGAGSGLKAYKSTFKGQCSPASLPFVDGETKMTFTRGDTDCILYQPDISASEAELKRLAHDVEGFASFNEAISGHVAFTGNKGGVVFKVDAPGEITRVTAGGMFGSRKGGTFNGIQFSLDDGKTWITGCKQPIAKDEADHPEEHWMQCVDGTLDVAAGKAYSLGCTPGEGAVRESKLEGAPGKTVLVKFFTEGGDGRFIRCDGIYVHYKRPSGVPLTVTHTWKGGKHEEKIGAGEASKAYTVKGGKLAENESIAIEAAAP